MNDWVSYIEKLKFSPIDYWYNTIERTLLQILDYDIIIATRN